MKVPNGITHELAATLMTKGLTTNYLLTKTYHLKAGETVLFHAAAGGVGQIFAQWANSIEQKLLEQLDQMKRLKLRKKMDILML